MALGLGSGRSGDNLAVTGSLLVLGVRGPGAKPVPVTRELRCAPSLHQIWQNIQLREEGNITMRKLAFLLTMALISGTILFSGILPATANGAEQSVADTRP